MEKKKIVKMLNDLCCSECHCSFGEDSISIVRREDNFMVLQIVCENCGKSFGIAMLGINSVEIKDDNGVTKTKFSDEDLKLKIEEDIPPISYDDILDAHEYIKNLDENWKNFIQEKNL